MASSQEFVNYVLEQMKDAGIMHARKMFGDYGFYCNDKFIGLICDNQCYLKITQPGEMMFEEPHYGIPYEGAKPYLLIEDLEDPSFLKRLVQATYEALPVKVKKASTSKQREKQEVKEKKPTLGS
ncbi:MAG: TfoX/Sxy family protein [Cellulosilyticum sp.]|nr:TfoX/Sxy family protein [Cellulosilyticum sp.]MEE1071736.1 TfoX/Sxy family protein [Cellulosilyticum sp.]